MRKGLFSPFITIPSHVLREFQRKVSLKGLKIAGFLGLSMTLLRACEAPYEPGLIAPVEGFAGLVAGDEPRAVLIGDNPLRLADAMRASMVSSMKVAS